MGDDLIDIKGGAGPEEAAAITAIIACLVDEARSAAAQPAQAPRQNAWVSSMLTRESHAPLPSPVYDAQPWGGEPDEAP